MLKGFCGFLLKLWGWKLEGRYPHQLKKCIIIVLPHTSNWDFPLGILLRCAMGAKGNFIGKDSLFKWPHGFIFRRLGGVPVERSKHHNYVQQVVEVFNKREELTLVIAPEGTRKKVDKLKTGFYYIALEAGVPIVRCKFDWGTKTVGFSEPMILTGDFEKDLAEVLTYYKGVKGYHPELGYEWKTI